MGGRVTGAGPTPRAGATGTVRHGARPAPARSIGILGGTFDPIHVGHLALARAARRALDLDEVVLVPAARPPHKPGRPVADARDRLAMVELAVADEPGLSVSRLELDRAGPSYTVDTVAAVLAAAARAGRRTEVTVILSAESFAGLPTWHEPDRLLELARVAVAPRAGHPAPTRAWLRRRAGDRSARVVAIEAALPDVSASDIRRRVAAGRSIAGLVPPAVAAWIDDHGLYREPDSRKDRS